MRFERLCEWLQWQSALHPSAVDLGLERSRVVARRLGLTNLSAKLVSVAGTNGKGSCVVTMEAIGRAAGYKTGAYLSPHLHRYNERVRVQGQDVSDDELVSAFALVDEARQDVSLTFFEFGTLAAVVVLLRAEVDLMLLEVGLGGRLDAVNVFDADVSVLTSIGIDHTEWLGETRDAIGREKAGIARSDKPCVIGDRSPPASVMNHTDSLGATTFVLGHDFHTEVAADTWTWRHADMTYECLALPALDGRHQIDNAATAIMALRGLGGVLSDDSVRAGLADTRLPGRFQLVRRAPDVILDVAHNPDAARVLAGTLSQRPCDGLSFALLGMYADKNVADSVAVLSPHIDEWFVAALDSPRGASARDTVERFGTVTAGAPVHLFDDVAQAYACAVSRLRSQDRLIAFGSHQTAAAVARLAT